jgi:UDP-N-acetylmuramoyl-tripeptide--D-alanyl-D-alanine ligase
MNTEQLHQVFLSSSGICTDTRKVEDKNIFFAIKGANFDGNSFAEEALQKGCSFAVIDNFEEKKDDRYIVVKNVLDTLQELARYHREKLNCPVIGITGTNGKTTTKELILAVLSSQFKTIATKGNLNNHIGVPLTLLSTPLDTELLIVEMGANHQGEISQLCKMASPDYGIITNIGKAHLEGFGGYDGVIKAKSELYQYIEKKEGWVFVNEKDELLLSLSENINRIAYGENCAISSCNPFVTLEYKQHIISSKMVGKYNYDNIVAACCIGEYFGVTSKNYKKSIESYQPTNNRSQVEKTQRGNTLILDAYNANPSSMLASINAFKELEGTKKTVILGDMLELGDDSIKEHQEIIDHLKQSDIFTIYLVGSEFQKTKHNYLCFNSVKELGHYLEKNALSENSILLKGSRKLQLEKLKAIL